MDAKVTMAISDMVSGITMAHDGIERTVTSGAIRDRNLSELIAARDYILSAESQIAERRDNMEVAQAEEDRLRAWWIGLPDEVQVFGSLHPENTARWVWNSQDIGNPTSPQLAVDRLRELVSATAHLYARRAAAGEGVVGEYFRPTEFYLDHLCDAVVACSQALLAERDAQIAEMRKVTGPKCPKCGGYVKIRHEIRVPWIPGVGRCLIREAQNDEETVGDVICISVADLIVDHPEIAAEVGLAEANDGM